MIRLKNYTSKNFKINVSSIQFISVSVGFLLELIPDDKEKDEEEDKEKDEKKR
jgi:hypothetical protein